MPVRAVEAVEVEAADKDGQAAQVAAAVKDWDAEWSAGLDWAQTSNPHSGETPGYRAHIARSPRAVIETSGASRAEARADSARASRAEAQRCRVEAPRYRVEAAEAPRCRVEAARYRVEAAEVSKAEAAEPSSAEISLPRAGA